MAMIRYADISATRDQFGYTVCSALVNGYLIERKYLYYTKREALRRFHEYVNGVTVK